MFDAYCTRCMARFAVLVCSFTNLPAVVYFRPQVHKTRSLLGVVWLSHIQGGPKKWHNFFLYALTLPNINRNHQTQ